jgi:EpsI family protein
MFAGAAGTHIAAAAGAPVIRAGARVLLAPAPDGAPRVLMIDNVCGGLRSLISLTWFAAVFAAVCRLGPRGKLALLVCAAPTALAANVLRIAALIGAAERWSVAAVDESTAVHQCLGLGAYAAALATLLAIEGLWLRLAGRPEPTTAAPARLGCTWPRLRPAGALALALSATAVAGGWARAAAAAPAEAPPTPVLPAELHIDGVRFVGQPIALASPGGDSLASAVQRAMDYRDRAGRWVRVVVVVGRDARRDIHAPQVCLAAAGAELLGRRRCSIGPAHRAIPATELITRDGADRRLHLATYRLGGRYLDSYDALQARAMLARLRGPTDVGLVRVTVPVESDDRPAARALACAAAKAVLHPGLAGRE